MNPSFSHLTVSVIMGVTTMRKKNYKGRCEKKSVPKCNEIF